MRLSEEIESIFRTDEASITFQVILNRVSQKSFGLLLVLLALPSALPVPAPGYSIPGGLALLALGGQMVVGYEAPWLPARILSRRIKTEKQSRLVNSMVSFLAFFERIIKPRLTFISRAPLYERFLGLVVVTCGISMCIPIPLTNTVPAMGVFMIGLGMIEEDGLISLAGIPVAVFGLSVTLSILVLIVYVGMNPYDAAEAVKSFLYSIFK